MRTSGFIYFAIFIGAFILSAALVPLCRRLAFRLNLVDRPAARKVHLEPKPLLGGGAVFLSFFIVAVSGVVIVFTFDSFPFFQDLFPGLYYMRNGFFKVLEKFRYLMAAGVLIFLIGLADDFLGDKLPTRYKFLGQILAALLVTLGGVRLSIFHNIFLDSLLGVIWIVGITNAFNLLDNMDGLTSGVAVICMLIFFFVAYLQHQFFITLLLLTLCGAVAGFLVYNFPPSRIFLGDAGSLFIGFYLGCFTVMESYATHANPSLFPVLMPLITLSVPLLDTISVMIIRIKNGQPIYKADKNHLSHRLVALGMSQRQAVLFIYLITFSLGIGATLLTMNDRLGNLIVTAQTISTILLIVIIMAVKKKSQNRNP
jgi:UDP-GlcNAc:undecaprenyl-phosphate GlcNAc-1-phosphate transferase